MDCAEMEEDNLDGGGCANNLLPLSNSGVESPSSIGADPSPKLDGKEVVAGKEWGAAVLVSESSSTVSPNSFFRRSVKSSLLGSGAGSSEPSPEEAAVGTVIIISR